MQQTAIIYQGDAAPTGPHAAHINRGDLGRIPPDLVLGAQHIFAVLHYRDIVAGAPHVGSNQVAHTGYRSQIGRPDGPTGWTRGNHLDGRTLDGINGRNPTGGVGHQWIVGDPDGRAKRVLQAAQVADHWLLDIGIYGGGADPLVFTNLAGHLVAHGYIDFGPDLADDLAHLEFVGRIGVGVKKTDGDGLDPCGTQGLHRRLDFGPGHRTITSPLKRIRSATSRRSARGISAGGLRQKML